MTPSYSQDFLAHFSGPRGALCTCGREHRLAPVVMEVAAGALQRLPELFSERFGGAARVWVLSDENTETAAGRECKALLGRAKVTSAVLPAEPRPRTTFVAAEGLAAEAKGARPELVLAVGSGTINDLGKMVSAKVGVPNWCVATAASVDAYTSGTAAVKAEGEAISVPIRPTEVVIADLSVLRAAPRLMFLSGLGDLLSKFLSYLDWRVAATVTGEYYCGESAELGLKSARQAIEAARQSGERPEESLRSLFDAAASSGLAMQGLGQSRPASSAEHTISHVWDMAQLAGNRELDLHGLLVGLACHLLEGCFTEFYGSLADRRLDVRARLAALKDEAAREPVIPPQLAAFGPQIERARTPEHGPVLPLEEQFARLEKARREIAELALPLLAELRQAVEALRIPGCPFRLSDFRLSAENALLPMRNVRLLRSRYSTFHLAHQVGAEPELLRCLEKRVAAEG